MKGIFVLVVTYILVIWGCNSDTTESDKKTVVKDSSNHSAAFNQNVSFMLQSYDKIKNVLVEADSVAAKEEGKKFLGLLDSINLEGIKSDTTDIETLKRHLNNIKVNAAALLEEQNITEIRQDFRIISENLFTFLKATKYNGPKLYWQNCPMAFNGDIEASWISREEEVVNPYLGMYHPEYKATMLHCGMVKDSIQ